MGSLARRFARGGNGVFEAKKSCSHVGIRIVYLLYER